LGPAQAKPDADTPADAAPQEAPPRIWLAAAHATALPATEPMTLAPVPLCYKLGRPAPEQTVIAGAMPVLPAVFFD
jgi:hypothetical protein